MTAWRLWVAWSYDQDSYPNIVHLWCALPRPARGARAGGGACRRDAPDGAVRPARPAPAEAAGSLPTCPSPNREPAAVPRIPLPATVPAQSPWAAPEARTGASSPQPTSRPPRPMPVIPLPPCGGEMERGVRRASAAPRVLQGSRLIGLSRRRCCAPAPPSAPFGASPPQGGRVGARPCRLTFGGRGGWAGDPSSCGEPERTRRAACRRGGSSHAGSALRASIIAL